MNDIQLPMVRRELPAMPVFYGNASISYFSNMLFADDLTAARRLTARLFRHYIQERLAKGIPIDPRYMNAFIDDIGAGRPTIKEVQRRVRWASNVGQIVKALLAMIDDPDPRVRARAGWVEAVEQIENLVERPRRNQRGARSGFHRPLDNLRRSLHMCCAWEMAAEGYRPPKTIDGMMLSAMQVFERLMAWHVTRPHHLRDSYLAAPVYWRWQDMAWDDSHGTPLLALGLDRLTSRGLGRSWPKK
jgi:hypothetical protein